MRLEWEQSQVNWAFLMMMSSWELSESSPRLTKMLHQVSAITSMTHVAYMAGFKRSLPVLSINSLTPGGCSCHFENIIFELISWIDALSAASKIVVRWMTQNSTDGKSTLVQVMAWCRQATSHCLSQCWPRSLSPYGVTRRQWVDWQTPGKFMLAYSALWLLMPWC